MVASGYGFTRLVSTVRTGLRSTRVKKKVEDDY
jgi:hypothetical protein